jgi:hypothetical protein
VQPEQPRECPPPHAPKAHDVGRSNLVSLVHDHGRHCCGLP